MSSLGPKQQVFASLAEIAQALGHAHRLELLEHLGQGERSVEDLAARAGLTLANTSRHLQLMRRTRLVQGRRNGKHVHYRLAGEKTVVDLLSALSRVGEHSRGLNGVLRATGSRTATVLSVVRVTSMPGRLMATARDWSACTSPMGIS